MGFWAIGVLSFSCPHGLFGVPLEGVGVLGCRPLSCVCYGSATVVLPGASPSFQCPLFFPLYSPSSVWGLALGAPLAALHTFGDLALAPLFTAAFFSVLTSVAAASCPPLYPSVVLFRFAFLVSIPPSQGFSALVFGLWAPPLPCPALCFSVVWDRRLCFLFFPFGLWVLFCLGRISGPSATASSLWAESVALGFLRSFSFLVQRCLLAPRSWSFSASLLLLVLPSFPSSVGFFFLGVRASPLPGVFPV